MEQKKWHIWYNTILVLLCLVDAFFGYWLITSSGWQQAIPALGHLVVCGLFHGTLYEIQRKDHCENANLLIIVSCFTVLLPLYGPPVMLVIHTIIKHAQIKSDSYFEFEELVLQDDVDNILKEFDGDLYGLARDEQDVFSFRDLFINDNDIMQERAITKLRRIGDRNSILLLKKVMKHSKTDANVLAASALIEIEETTIKKIEKLKEHIRVEESKPEHTLELARLYSIYCYIGVLDPSLMDHYIEQALHNYLDYSQQVPEDIDAHLELGRMLYKSGRFEEAHHAFNKALKIVPEDTKSHLWLTEMSYENYDFLNVKEKCMELDTREDLPENCKSAVSLWANGK